MLFVELSLEMQISGFLSFIHNLITILLSILILLKAIKLKKTSFYVLSLFMLFSAVGAYQIGLNYIYWIFTQNLFPYQTKVLIGTSVIGIATIAWIYIYLDMIYPKLKIKISIIYLIFVVVFYIYLFYFLYFAPNAPVQQMIGIDIFPYQVSYLAFVLVAFFTSLIITTITTYHLAYRVMKNKDNPELQWKGRFLALGITIIMISVMLDVNVGGLIPMIIAIRILGIIAMIFIYLGFILPNWIRKILKVELKR